MSPIKKSKNLLNFLNINLSNLVIYKSDESSFPKKTQTPKNEIGDVPEPGDLVRWIRLGKLVRMLSLPHYVTSVWIFYDQI